MKIKIACGYCKKEFEVYPSFIKNGAGKHCSRHCASKTHKQYRRTPELNRKMSNIIKRNQKVLDARRIAVEIAAQLKKGKTYEQIYGETRGQRLRKKISSAMKGILNPNFGNGGKIMGNNNPNWRNGKSFEPYTLEFNKTIKEIVRMRSFFCCSECGVHEKELLRKLDIHHIDYDKLNNSPFNLTALCKKCHSKTNFNRSDWTKYYKQKICF